MKHFRSAMSLGSCLLWVAAACAPADSADSAQEAEAPATAEASDEAPQGPGSTDPVELALMAAPEAERATATVMLYEDGGMVTAREGSGNFICLGDNPDEERFQVACYHKDLEPYMARGRELRADGITGKTSIETRWSEIEAGSLSMPAKAASLHQLIGADQSAVTTNSAGDLRRLTVIYMPFVTAEEMGLPPMPEGDNPWVMYSGSPTAHVMIPG